MKHTKIDQYTFSRQMLELLLSGKEFVIERGDGSKLAFRMEQEDETSKPITSDSAAIREYLDMLRRIT